MTIVGHITFTVRRTDTGFKVEQNHPESTHVGRGETRAAAIIDYCERYTEDSDE